MTKLTTESLANNAGGTSHGGMVQQPWRRFAAGRDGVFVRRNAYRTDRLVGVDGRRNGRSYFEREEERELAMRINSYLIALIMVIALIATKTTRVDR